MQAELFLLATTDPLTGLYNRRQFFQLARPVIEQAIRQKQEVAVLLFDIDHFKQINDHYSHEVGDQVIIEVANLTRSILRSSDIICRYGGEEFVALLPETNRAAAEVVAERLRQMIEVCVLVHDTQERVAMQVTVSIGVVIGTPRTRNYLERSLHDADQAMYRAKQSGRNRVVVVQIEVS